MIIPRDFAKLTSKRNLVKLGVLLLVIVVGFSTFAYEHHKNITKINPSLANRFLAKPSVRNCSQDLKQLDAERPNPKDLKNSINMLNYRSFCQDALKQFPAALATLQQLKAYYVMAKQTNALVSIDYEIAGIKLAMAPHAAGSSPSSNPWAQ